MVKSIYFKLKSDGMINLLKVAYYHFFPKQLKYFPLCRSIFESGRGLEIGGPSNIFKKGNIIPVYPIACKIDNCNFHNQTTWEKNLQEGNTFFFDSRKKPGFQYIVEASNLQQRIAEFSYDFVLSSHCIEHLANPIKGLKEWVRVLRPGGVIVLIVPHKDGTFDHCRAVTSLDHLVQDFEKQVTEDDMTHLEEILRYHDLKKDPDAGDLNAFRERSKHNNQNRCLHHHVFDTHLAVELIHFMQLQILTVELFYPYHIAIIAQKVSNNQPINNEKFRNVYGCPCWSSPFLSDRAVASLF